VRLDNLLQDRLGVRLSTRHHDDGSISLAGSLAKDEGADRIDSGAWVVDWRR
jgi:hypothetical protein